MSVNKSFAAFLMVLTLGLCAALYGDATTQKVESGVQKLQGEWKATAATMDGEQATPEMLAVMSFTIKGDQIVAKTQENDPGTLKLDDNATPAHLDVTDKTGHVDHSIYKMEGNKLTICTGSKDYPKEFNADKGSGNMLLVMERVEKK